MANPRTPKSIAVTCTNAHTGSTLYAQNLTTGETLKITTSSGKAIINTSNFETAVTVGDVIQFKIFGDYYGYGSKTLTAADSNTVTMTLVQSTTTNAPAISF